MGFSVAIKYKNQSCGTGLDSLKTTSKKVAHKVSEFLGNKIAEAATTSNNNKIVKPGENSRNIDEIIIPLKNKTKQKLSIIKINKSIVKTERYKMPKLLIDWTVSNFVTKKRVEVNYLWSRRYSIDQNMRFKNPMVRSDLCEYSDVYIMGE